MRLKRRPTVKTALVLAGVAVVCSAAVGIVPRDDWHGPEYYDVNLRFWNAAAVAGVFWLIIPLILGMLVDSPRTAGRIALALGLSVLVLNWIASTRIHLRLGYANVPVEKVVLSTLYGPLLCFDVLRAVWETMFRDSQFVLAAICALWLFVFWFVAFQVAESCRTRGPVNG